MARSDAALAAVSGRSSNITSQDSPKMDATGTPVCRRRTAASAVASWMPSDTAAHSFLSLCPGGQPRPRYAAAA